uniref:Uncharacterized protein n=1 Tax=Moniliophthora roreri TaxID=221103 RepID=A0A0W0G0D1_MONRR
MESMRGKSRSNLLEP